MQVGFQSHADRYTYLPQIGVCFGLTWLVADLSANWPGRRWILGAGAALSLAMLMSRAENQTRCWRDSESLWTQAIVSTADNAIACNNLGGWLLDEGNFSGAITNCEKALAIKPDYADAHDNLGVALLRNGNVEAAIVHLKESLAINPQLEDARINLANAILNADHANKATGPDQTSLSHAADQTITPENFVHTAWVLATSTDPSIRDGNKAVELARRADQVSEGKSPLITGILAAAYAETGSYSEAIAKCHQAMQLAEAQHNRNILIELQDQLKCYEAGRPFRASEATP